MLPQQGCLVGDCYLPAIREGKHVAVAWYDGEWDDIGSPSALIKANKRWLERQRLTHWVHQDARVSGGVWLEGSVVCEGASVTGEGRVGDSVVMAWGSVNAPVDGIIAMGDGRLVGTC